MKKLFIAAMMSVFALTAAEGQEYSYERHIIQVTGKAEREVTPDEIYVRIVINENQMKQKQSVEKMERDMTDALRSIGVDVENNLKIDDMSSAFIKKGQPRTSATYQLKLGSAGELGLAYQALESIGISNITVTKVSHSQLKKIQQEMRIEAVKDAQEIARSMAKALGQGIGLAVHIVDYNNDVYFPVLRSSAAYDMAKAEGGSANYYETPVEFKNIKLNYSVTVKFVLDIR